jgi:hypothetical protein
LPMLCRSDERVSIFAVDEWSEDIRAAAGAARRSPPHHPVIPPLAGLQYAHVRSRPFRHSQGKIANWFLNLSPRPSGIGGRLAGSRCVRPSTTTRVCCATIF